MKKLLTTLLFIGMFSQVSLCQIWESDTISTFNWENHKFILRFNHELIYVSASPPIFENNVISDNFSLNFRYLPMRTCCIAASIKDYKFYNSIQSYSADTIMILPKIPHYYEIPLNTIDPVILVDKGTRHFRTISASVSRQVYRPSFGNYTPISIEFIRSMYYFNTKKALLTLVATRWGRSNKRNTNCYMGVWAHNQPFRLSSIPTRFPVLDYEFPYKNNLGFSAGYAGFIGKTLDSGYTWTALTQPPIKADWDDIIFPDSSNGWVFGHVIIDSSNSLMRTYPVAINTPDGGRTWFQVACDTNYVWKNKWFNNIGIGWAIRDHKRLNYSELVKTADYGNSWSVQILDTNYFFVDMLFVDSANAVLLANPRPGLGSLPSKVYIKTSSTLGTFKKYLSKLELYPNPTFGKFKLRGYKEEEGLTLRIFSNSGKEVWRGIPSPDGEIDISQLSPGLYHLEALTTSGKRWSTRVVRE